jgi:hypothetical protein
MYKPCPIPSGLSSWIDGGSHPDQDKLERSGPYPAILSLALLNLGMKKVLDA